MATHEMSFSELLNTSSQVEAQAVHIYKPIWVLAAENNEKDKVLTLRSAKHDRSFTGC